VLVQDCTTEGDAQVIKATVRTRHKYEQDLTFSDLSFVIPAPVLVF